MNKTTRINKALNLLFNSLVQDGEALWETELGQSVCKTSNRIVAIIDEIKNAGDMDAMIGLEKILQLIDFRDAQTKIEKSSAKKAIDDYKQIIAVITQMRTDPKAYVLANESLQADGLKLPPSRGTNQIRANVARLTNRNSFPSPEYKAIWEARIKLAKATQQKLAELHEETIERYNHALAAKG